MKADTLFIPLRLTKKNGFVFCYDSKGKPRTYNSMDSLIENMPEPFDNVGIYNRIELVPLKRCVNWTKKKSKQK